MDFRFCELSAAIGYATCYYETYENSDLGEALSIGLSEFTPSPHIDPVTMASLVSHLDVATKEYQSDREDEDEDEDEDQDEDQE
jgi:hypothetical protein